MSKIPDSELTPEQLKQRQKTIAKLRAWATSHEIKYINNIGSYVTHRPLPHRDVLLERYFLACQNRTTWGDIDKATVMKHLQELVA